MKERGFICQNCHMPEIERPVATGGPILDGVVNIPGVAGTIPRWSSGRSASR